MVDVFISYSRDNEDRVRLLAEKVRELGYVLWWDEELPPHKSYGDVITEKIGQAKAGIVVWSETAVQSEWVRAEADVARNQKKLIQVTLDDAQPPMPFNQIQFVKLGDWNGEPDHRGWTKVQGSLAELCGRTGDETVPAVPRPAAAPAPTDVPPSAEDIREELRTKRRGPAIRLIAVSVIALIAIIAFRVWNNYADREPLEPAEEESAVVQSYPLDAVVQDPTGFAYIRIAPSGNSAVVGRVMANDIFNVSRTNDRWWPVMTEDGAEGYIDSQQVRVIDGG